MQQRQDNVDMYFVLPGDFRHPQHDPTGATRGETLFTGEIYIQSGDL